MTQIPREPRKSVMLAATLQASGVDLPVRIRNMSSRGAMVDGPYLPEPESTVSLSRLALQVAATVVWQHDGRCGLKLAEEIRPDDWVAGVRADPAHSSPGQMRVDGIQAALRQGAEMPAPPSNEAPAGAVDRDRLDELIAAEIDQVGRSIEGVLDELMQDPEVLARHQRALQSIDIACNVLDSLAPVLRAAERDKAVEKIAMHEVRNRLSGRQCLT